MKKAILTIIILLGCKLNNSSNNSSFIEKLLPKSAPCTKFKKEGFEQGRYAVIETTYMENLSGDLYVPLVKPPFPAVLHIHGGGWVSGSRRLKNAVLWGEFFSCNGIAFFDAEYTLGGDIKKQVKELKCALLWLKKNGKEFGIDGRIIVMGGSAGGHLSALLAETWKEKKFYPDDCPIKPEKMDDLKVQGGVHLYGVFDFGKFFYGKLLPVDLSEENAPIKYVDNVDYPVLLIHGSEDILTKEQSLYYGNVLKSKGKDADVFIIEGAQHAFDLEENEFLKKAQEKVKEFISRYKPTKPNITHDDTPEELLSKGFLRQAYIKFKEDEKKNGKNCKNQYGKFVSLFFEHLNYIFIYIFGNDFSKLFFPQEKISLPITSLQTKTSSLSIKSLTELNINSIYTNFIIPYEEEYKIMEDAQKFISENNCVLELPKGIKINFDLNKKVVFGEIFTSEFSELVISIINAMKFFFDFVFSHDLNIYTKNILDVAEYIKLSDVVGTLRVLGALTERENFLTFTKPEKFLKSKEDMLKSISSIKNFIQKLFFEKDNIPPQKKIIGYKDNGDGKIGPGDKIYIGIIDIEGGDYLFDVGLIRVEKNFTLPDIFLAFINDEYIKGIMDMLQKIENHLKGNVERIKISDLNSLIPSNLRSSFSIPDILEFNINKFFSSQKPIREYLPKWTDFDPPPDGGDTYIKGKHKIFLAEGEISQKSPIKKLKAEETPPQTPEDYCYICYPGDRFKFYDLSIKDDCIYPESDILFLSSLIYIYWKDPSFSQSVFTNLDGLPCEIEERGFKLPDNYSINKAINYIIKKVLEIRFIQ